jgi:hypothetical protein
LSCHPFDRYLLFLIPAAVVLILDATREWRFPVWATTGALSAYLLFAAVITMDSLAWNRAVWKEERDLVANGVLAREIDGGWAWTGYSYLSGPAVPGERLRQSTPTMGHYTWFPGSCDNYLFSFSARQRGFRLVKEILYSGLPLRENRRIYLLARVR